MALTDHHGHQKEGASPSGRTTKHSILSIGKRVPMEKIECFATSRVSAAADYSIRSPKRFAAAGTTSVGTEREPALAIVEFPRYW